MPILIISKSIIYQDLSKAMRMSLYNSKSKSTYKIMILMIVLLLKRLMAQNSLRLAYYNNSI